MFGISAEALLAMANEKFKEVEVLHASRPEIALVLATEAQALATMAIAQATLEQRGG